MLIEVRRLRHRTGVEARLVGERRRTHVGLLRRLRHVDHLGDVVAHRGEPLQALKGKRADVELEREVRDRRSEVGVA